LLRLHRPRLAHCRGGVTTRAAGRAELPSWVWIYIRARTDTDGTMVSMGQAQPDQTHPPDLEISHDLAFQQRTWAVQRIGWVMMLLFVVAAAVGLFSVGPLSWTQTRDPEGLIALEYERFGRYMAPTTLRLRLEPSATSRDRVAVRMNRALTEDLEIQHIRPAPERMTASPDGMRFEFDIAARGEPANITFSVRPQSIGRLRGEVGLIGHEPARPSLFVYP